MNVNFSFIILTLNEEIHLDRLLDSIAGLNAKTFVLDSGSTDKTLQICEVRKIEVQHNDFLNHPTQWDVALRNFKVTTPWTIGLDADQVLSAELYKLLYEFTPSDYTNIDGIYFNRKNYFQNQWIKHGGYYPMYLLKMFKTDLGFSDLSENMDHRFQVPGKTMKWKDGHIIEENLKENNINFWIRKHNIYSDLIADEEHSQIRQTLKITGYNGIFGMPNQRKIWKKQLWQRLPLYLRSCLYFFYRLIIQRGILDGKKGILFHFLQGFWFRVIVDMKIEERRGADRPTRSLYRLIATKFVLKFVFLFLFFYYINITFISLSSPGGFHITFVERHLNYIQTLRTGYISVTAFILENMGFSVRSSSMRLTVINHSGFRLVYSCLGYGLMSCFSAFALTIPKPFKSRYLFLVLGIILILMLNICRLLLVAIYNKPSLNIMNLDHHDIFNFLTYATILIFSYIYLSFLKHDK
ncbi:glycosyltransferase [Pedobacter sp. JCM 36344]|uniref:glycosyltransferase n=1 Tax=Pedobacter sp. JCM 36344 TaxID=3374280 RepID=UPI00397AA35A